MKLGALPLASLDRENAGPAMTRMVAHAAAGLAEIGLTMPMINSDIAGATLGLSDTARQLLRQPPESKTDRER